jgi:Zn-dependent peptidase ImmA (M78 family)
VYKNKKGLEFWINKLEELGVLVFQFYGIKPEEMRGYALTYDKLPIIGINNQDHPNGKKFTLFHELAHLIIKKEGISSFNKYDLPNSDEIFCNAVAAEVLVPEKDLLAKVDQIGVRGNWTNDKINKLKNFFNVSSEVIVRRLLTLKLVEPDFYKSKKEEWNKFIPHSGSKAKERTVDQGRRERDEPCSDREKDINLINTRKAVMAIKRNGVYYTEIVLSAYDSQLITNSTMTGYLGETLQVVEEIRKKLLEEIEE